MTGTWKFGSGNKEKKITGNNRKKEASATASASQLGKFPLAINFSSSESILKVREERKSYQTPKLKKNNNTFF